MKDKDNNKDPGKLKTDEYNPTQMRNVAKAFLLAAKRCNEPPVKQVGWSQPLLIPIVTNLAFACELFLKTLLQKSGSPKGGHNLLDLFNSLPEEIQNEITGLNKSQEFVIELKQISRLFEEWRYIYEHHLKSLNFSFLLEFAERLSICTDKRI